MACNDHQLFCEYRVRTRPLSKRTASQLRFRIYITFDNATARTTPMYWRLASERWHFTKCSNNNDSGHYSTVIDAILYGLFLKSLLSTKQLRITSKFSPSQRNFRGSSSKNSTNSKLYQADASWNEGSGNKATGKMLKKLTVMNKQWISSDELLL